MRFPHWSWKARPSPLACVTGERGSAEQATERLPDLHADIITTVHLVSRLNAEGVVERDHVSHRAGDAEEAGGVHVCLDADSEVLGTDLVHPAQGPAYEVTLRGSEAADRFAALVLVGFLERVPGDVDAAEVGDVFALGGLAVYVGVADGDVIVELFHDPRGALGEFVGIFLDPPFL